MSNPNFTNFRDGIEIVPKTTSTVANQGQFDVTSADGKIHYHNGTTSSPLVTESSTATLTNKTIDADSNTITNIENADIKAGAAIDASKIADGSVSSTEFQYLDGVTSNIQTQLNSISGSGISSLTGDVSATGPGAAAATVNLVGGSSAVNVHNAELLANAATSSNTASTIVKRDGSKNFHLNGLQLDGSTSGTITLQANDTTSSYSVKWPAAQGSSGQVLTDDGSGNLTWASPTGGSSITALTGDITATGPGSAAATVALVGGKSAASVATSVNDTIAATSTNTSSTIVKRDGSGNIAVSRITTATIGDNGAGVSILPSSSQDISLDTSGSGHILIKGNGATIAEQGSTPSNPAAGYSSIYPKTDHLFYSLDSSGNERLIGSGGGSGINFLTLNTSFVSANSDNSNAEASIGNWATYKSGTTVPTTLTGGSATHLTLSRTTTAGEVLDGLGSFKIVKSAANSQGEGTSCVANVPVGYRGQIASIQMPFKIISGSLVSGDLLFFVEDVTNSQIIAPYNNIVLNSPSVLQMTFNVPSTCAQIRVGFFFATTSTSAVTFTWDDITVGPQQIVYGPAMTDWNNDLTFLPSAGFGTTTSSDIRYKRVGDSMLVRGYFLTGTTAGSTAYIQLPAGYTIDTNKLGSRSNSTQVGEGHGLDNSGPATVYQSSVGLVMFYDGSTNNQIFVANEVNTKFYTKINSNGFLNSGDGFNFEFSVPILGWSTNVASVNSSVFNISSLLQNGTRVTGSAPTQLGQYRSYLRNANGVSYTETNGTPTATPTSADGLLIYDGNGYNANDTNNQPTRYEIFVGKNKTVRWQFYASAGRTGFVDVTPSSLSSIDYGYFTNYDPTTGIAAIVANRVDTGSTAHRAGNAGDGGNNVTNSYFDIIISENALAVQTAPVRSEIWVDTGNGEGSSNTAIRRFSNNPKNTGSAITYADSSTLGASFTINENGLYSMSYSDSANGNVVKIGISVNSAQLTTNIMTITAANRIMAGGGDLSSLPGDTTTVCNVSAITALNVGDVIRPHTDGNPNGTGAAVKFIITKVNN